MSQQESGIHLALNQNTVDRAISASRSLGHWPSRLVFTTVCGAKNREWSTGPKKVLPHYDAKLHETRCILHGAFCTCGRRMTCATMVRELNR